MSRARPYIAAGLDHHGRIEPTPLQAYEDAAGTCNTCPGELAPAECLQADPKFVAPPVPWRAIGAGLAVLICVPLALHLVLVLAPAVMQVAAR